MQARLPVDGESSTFGICRAPLGNSGINLPSGHLLITTLLPEITAILRCEITVGLGPKRSVEDILFDYLDPERGRIYNDLAGTSEAFRRAGKRKD